jgi:cell division initiation protein
MKLTPLDIRHREFKRGMRGYADVEVDEFLDQVADEYERLFKENIDLTERLEALQEKVTGYRRIEDTLQKTLVSAQASAEELKQNATKEAQLILRDAELKGRQMVNDTYSEKQAIEQSMAKLRAAEQDFVFKFRQMLEGYLSQVDKAQERKGSEESAEFGRQAQAIKDAIAREAVPSDAAEPAAEPAVAEAKAEPAQPASSGTPVTPDEPAPQAHGDDAETTMSRAAAPEAMQAEAHRAARPGRERASFGAKDDLLADVDGGVNEDEFKW